MNKVVSIRNIKGGVGKTTLATNMLGVGQRDASACLIDIEGNDSMEWMRRGGRYGGHVAEARSEERLRYLLEQAALRRWWSFINTPGERSTPVISAAVAAASLVVIPMTCNQLDLPRTVDTVKEIRRANRKFLIVLNKAMPRVEGVDARQTAAVRETLSPYRENLWAGQITRAILFDYAAIAGVSVVDYGPHERAAIEIASLFAHIRRLCQ